MRNGKNQPPLRTAYVYLVFGVLWIVFTDRILEVFIPASAPAYVTAQTFKGWFFVGLSTLLIYFIIWNDTKALRESRERYRLLFERNPQPMWVYDLETLRFLVVNDAAVLHYGYTREEFLGMTIKDIRPAEETPRLLENLARETGTLQKSEGWKHRLRNGTLIDVEIISHALDFEGKLARLVTANDITERKRAEANVQMQLRRITALNEIDRAINSILDMHLSLDVLLNKTLSQLNVDAASVLLLNEADQTLEFFAGRGFRSQTSRHPQLALGEGFAGQVALECRILHFENIAALPGQYKRIELLKNDAFVEYYGVPLIAKGNLKGVLEIFNRTPLMVDKDWLHYLETLGGQAAIAIDNAQLFDGLQRSNQELIAAYDATIAGWSHAMDLRDKETEGHTQRVTDLTLRLAKRLGVSEQERAQMRRGALLHDIGKLGVPDHILLKPGKLSDEEWEIMRRHPTYAFEMLEPIRYLRLALDIPYCHHEKWDGTGYPRGLKGEQIPFAARIFAVVDVWDALRSDRPYRAGWSVEKIRDYIREQSGKHFEPQVVEAFLSMMDG